MIRCSHGIVSVFLFLLRRYVSACYHCQLLGIHRKSNTIQVLIESWHPSSSSCSLCQLTLGSIVRMALIDGKIMVLLTSRLPYTLSVFYSTKPCPPSLPDRLILSTLTLILSPPILNSSNTHRCTAQGPSTRSGIEIRFPKKSWSPRMHLFGRLLQTGQKLLADLVSLSSHVLVLG